MKQVPRLRGPGTLQTSGERVTVWKRANTPEEKDRVLREMLHLWNVPPDLRLGQLVYNAVTERLVRNKRPAAGRDIGREIFYIEDDDLLTTIAAFVMNHYPPKDSASTSS